MLINLRVSDINLRLSERFDTSEIKTYWDTFPGVENKKKRQEAVEPTQTWRQETKRKMKSKKLEEAAKTSETKTIQRKELNTATKTIRKSIFDFRPKRKKPSGDPSPCMS